MCRFLMELGSGSLMLTEMIHALGVGQESNNGTGPRMTGWSSGLSLGGRKEQHHTLDGGLKFHLWSYAVLKDQQQLTQ